jgi:hypothetical protein
VSGTALCAGIVPLLRRLGRGAGALCIRGPLIIRASIADGRESERCG